MGPAVEQPSLTTYRLLVLENLHAKDFLLRDFVHHALCKEPVWGYSEKISHIIFMSLSDVRLNTAVNNKSVHLTYAVSAAGLRVTHSTGMQLLFHMEAATISVTVDIKPRGGKLKEQLVEKFGEVKDSDEKWKWTFGLEDADVARRLCAYSLGAMLHHGKVEEEEDIIKQLGSYMREFSAAFAPLRGDRWSSNLMCRVQNARDVEHGLFVQSSTR